MKVVLVCDTISGRNKHKRNLSFRMLERIKKLTNWQVAIIIAIIGFAVFFPGLRNQFQGDDNGQIVNNIPVHSITNIRLFFEGGTFYNGGGMSSPLTGNNYRPLMTTFYSVIYTLFGPHPFYFHLFQLSLVIASAFILYLILTYSFDAVWALCIALVFLVHPANSQAVYAIPSLEDALFFFFGILALWLLLRFRSVRSLGSIAICLLLSLLAKESGALFVAMALLYLFWFDRKRLLPFVGIFTLPLALYLTLRLHAGDISRHSELAPIDNLGLSGRILTMPSIMLFYLLKFIFPWKLASGYFWTFPQFSVRHTLFPLVVDLAVFGLFVYLGLLVRRRAEKPIFYTYLFFAVWAAIGLLMVLQIFPLDMTAGEAWFYFPMAGILGMIGVVLSNAVKVKPVCLVAVALCVIGISGIRTNLRGHDWSSQYNLAVHDIAASKEDYYAYNNVAAQLINQREYEAAMPYAQRSISIHPYIMNYINLGVILGQTGNYVGAVQAFDHSLKFGDYNLTYDDIAPFTLVTGEPEQADQYFVIALSKFPHDSTLWMYRALLEDKYSDNADAKNSIAMAAKYGPVPQDMYNYIQNNQSFTYTIVGQSVNF